jgi:hypothetical protein
MSRSNLVIANQSFPGTRTDLNLALLALGSLSSSSYAPAPTYANMLWYDTSTNILKMRSEANDVWINVGYLDQSSNAFRIFDDTQVVDTSGVQTGLIGDQATSAWELGTATLQSLVSPANVKAAIDALVPVSPVKAWVNFNGIGTISIRASSNVSSIGDNAFGDYTVNFTTAFSNANYASFMSAGSFSTNLAGQSSGYNTYENNGSSGKAAGSCRFLTGIHTGATNEWGDVSFTAIGA